MERGVLGLDGIGSVWVRVKILLVCCIYYLEGWRGSLEGVAWGRSYDMITMNNTVCRTGWTQKWVALLPSRSSIDRGRRHRDGGYRSAGSTEASLLFFFICLRIFGIHSPFDLLTT